MNPALGLAAGRIVLGTAGILTPRLFARVARLDPDTNPQLTYMTRMFGSREIALGAATLLTRGNLQRNLIAAGILVDVSDVAAGLMAAGSGEVSKPTGAMLALPALAAVAAGVAGLPEPA